MARFIQNSRNQGLFLTVDLDKQLIPGTLEYTIDELVENYLDLTNLVSQFKNDAVGAAAYNPKDLLKVLFYAYFRGVTTSREIEQLCRENILFIALSGDLRPDHATIARFVQKLQKSIHSLFSQLLTICDELGLIAGTELAIDGCKISSNAAKESSGTLNELKRKQEKYEQIVSQIIESTLNDNTQPTSDRIQRHKKKISRIKTFIENNAPRMGSRKREVKSNITDNESAKLTSSHGVIQGYNALAAVDSKHQIITSALAVGTQGEGPFLKTLIETAQEILPKTINKKTMILADTGYFSEANCKYIFDSAQNAVVPDQHFRQRNPKFLRSIKGKNKNPRNKKARRLYGHDRFRYLPDQNKYECPAGKLLKNDGVKNMHGHIGRVYKNKDGDCYYCHLKAECMRKNSKNRAIFIVDKPKEMTYSERMKKVIDSPEGRKAYSKRMGIVEPVFGNITFNKKLNRFNYRGKANVNLIWKLYCMIHNIEKLHKYGRVN